VLYKTNEDTGYKTEISWTEVNEDIQITFYLEDGSFCDKPPVPRADLIEQSYQCTGLNEVQPEVEVEVEQENNNLIIQEPAYPESEYDHHYFYS
jgi:hypothetical protein